MKKFCTGFLVFTMAAALVFAAGTTETAKGAQKYTLRVSMVISTDDPLYKGYGTFAENVQKRTNGGMQVTLYPNAQLGQAPQAQRVSARSGDLGGRLDQSENGCGRPFPAGYP